MQKVILTARFKADPIIAGNEYASAKKAQREHIKQQYPGAKVLSQQLITDGIPDVTSLGDLKTNGEVAIRTEFEISESQAEKHRKKMR
ncbi:MAG TPA: hypothetical protein PK911_05060 [Candidatus Saccharibacteria bacterium]|nr:hypothetical protein [Candidatus Saccharibacteria bacterium]